MLAWVRAGLLIGFSVLFCQVQVSAQTGEVAYCSPIGARRGETVELTIHSTKEWGEPLGLWNSFRADHEFILPISKKANTAPPKPDPKQIHVKLTIPSDAPCG